MKTVGDFLVGIFDKSEADIKHKEEKVAQRKHEAWLRSPVGLAATALENNAGFFELEIEVGTSNRDVSFGLSDSGSYKKSHKTGLLSEIEDLGWVLEQVGYYFMPTGEVSRDRFLASGQNVAVKGKTMGVYLFRNHLRNQN